MPNQKGKAIPKSLIGFHSEIDIILPKGESKKKITLSILIQDKYTPNVKYIVYDDSGVPVMSTPQLFEAFDKYSTMGEKVLNTHIEELS